MKIIMLGALGAFALSAQAGTWLVKPTVTLSGTSASDPVELYSTFTGDKGFPADSAGGVFGAGGWPNIAEYRASTHVEWFNDPKVGSFEPAVGVVFKPFIPFGGLELGTFTFNAEPMLVGKRTGVGKLMTTFTGTWPVDPIETGLSVEKVGLISSASSLPSVITFIVEAEPIQRAVVALIDVGFFWAGLPDPPVTLIVEPGASSNPLLGTFVPAPAVMHNLVEGHQAISLGTFIPSMSAIPGDVVTQQYSVAIVNPGDVLDAYTIDGSFAVRYTVPDNGGEFLLYPCVLALIIADCVRRYGKIA